MYQKICFSESDVIFDSNDSLINVDIESDEQGIQILAGLLIRNMQLGRATIAILPNAASRSALIQYLEDKGLKNIVHVVRLEDQFSLHDLGIYQQRVQTTPPHGIQEKIIEIQFKNQLKSLQVQGSFDSSQIDTWNELSEVKNMSYLRFNLDQQEYKWTFEELTSFKQQIEIAAELYQPKFEIQRFQRLNQINSQTPHDHKTLHESTLEIHKSLNELNQRFEGYIQREYQIYDEVQCRDKRRLSEIIQLIKYLLSLPTPIKKEKSLFSGLLTSGAPKKPSELSPSFWINKVTSELQNTSIFARKLKSIEHLEISQWLAEAESLLTSSDDILFQNFKDHVRTFNAFNQDNNELKSLYDQMDATLESINVLGIFNMKYEANSHSFVLRWEYLKKTIADIQTILEELISDQKWIQWTTLQKTWSNPLLSIINQLKNIEPNVWKDTFENWYYHEMILKHLRDNTSFDKVEFIRQFYNSLQIHFWDMHFKNNIHEIKLLESDNKALAHTIKNNKIDKNTPLWHTLINHNTAWVARSFPYLIIDVCDLNHFKANQFDTLINYNIKDINPDVLQLTNSVYSIFKNESIPTSAFKVTNHLAIPQDIRLFDVSKRLTTARHITTTLLHQGIRPKLYMTKKGSIFFYGRKYLEDVLVQQLYHLGLKEIDIDTNREQIVTGAIIDSAENITIVIENHLFDSTQTEKYIWQFECLEWLEASGCNVISINNDLIFEERKVYLNSVFKQYTM